MAKSFPRKFLQYLSTIGVPLAIGFLAFAGAMVIFPNIGFGLFFAVIAISVEGRVYNNYIKKALKRLFSPDFLRKNILDAKFREIIIQQKSEHCPFQSKALQKLWADYIQVLNTQQSLDPNDPDYKIKYKKHKTQLSTLYGHFLVEFDHNPTEQDLLQKRIIKTLQLKVWLKRGAWIITLLAAASCGFTVASAMTASLYAILGAGIFAALAPALPYFIPAVVGIVVTLAVLGYTFMIYQTLCDIIQNDIIQKEIRKLRELFQSKETSWAKKIGTVAVMLLVACICITATIATAGTWWNGTALGVRLLPKIFLISTIAVTVCTVPFYVLTNFIFNFKNSVTLIGFLFNLDQRLVLHMVRQKMKEIKDTWNKQTWLQRLNPIRPFVIVLEAIRDVGFFILHGLAIAFVSDRGFLNPELASIAGALNEMLTDFVPYYEELIEHVQQMQGRKVSLSSRGSSETVEKRDTKRAEQPLHEYLQQEAHCSSTPHDHDHGSDPITIGLTAAIRPVRWLSRQWDRWGERPQQPPAPAAPAPELDESFSAARHHPQCAM
jgi:hypothetical protein